MDPLTLVIGDTLTLALSVFSLVAALWGGQKAWAVCFTALAVVLATLLGHDLAQAGFLP